MMKRQQITDALRQAILRANNDICQYCKCSVATAVDHIIPVNKGGANDLENLTAICQSCNSKKSDNVIPDPYIGIVKAVAINRVSLVEFHIANNREQKEAARSHAEKRRKDSRIAKPASRLALSFLWSLAKEFSYPLPKEWGEFPHGNIASTCVHPNSWEVSEHISVLELRRSENIKERKKTKRDKENELILDMQREQLKNCPSWLHAARLARRLSFLPPKMTEKSSMQFINDVSVVDVSKMFINLSKNDAAIFQRLFPQLRDKHIIDYDAVAAARIYLDVRNMRKYYTDIVNFHKKSSGIDSDVS